ncbi:MAG: STAS domain-containing protein [Planctomycetes bacterium]|nr:STAS domain-containing protein [Planctomycetota bacterium]
MSSLPAPSEAFRITVEQRGDCAIAKLSGSANMDVSGNLQDRLYELIDLPIKRLVLDLSDLDFMSSVGLGAIIAAHLRSRLHDCEIQLVGPQPRILELLNLAQVTRLLGVFKTLDEALAV